MNKKDEYVNLFIKLSFCLQCMRASCIYRIIKCRRGEGYNPQTIGARLSFTDAGALSKKQKSSTYILQTSQNAVTGT